MFQNRFALVILGAILCTGLLTSSVRSEPLNKRSRLVKNEELRVQVEDLHPFTRFAFIPADSDPRTIRFEAAKEIEVPTKIRYTTDLNYCANVTLFRDPGGSMECPFSVTESPTAAYEVIYSFGGQELASDEYGLRHFRFQVYFRPGELVSDVRSALSNRKLSRAEKGSYFTVTTSRGAVQQVVIDEAQSSLCNSIPVDANWVRTDPNCQERINYKTITTPSEYITVRVDPIAAH
jgi:hypothetical protein